MAGVPREWEYEDVFDTLDMACGDALLELRLHIATLAPGAKLMVCSHDAGAPVELPAWCRLTGHTLLEARPPFYLIEKRTIPEEPPR